MKRTIKTLFLTSILSLFCALPVFASVTDGNGVTHDYRGGDNTYIDYDAETHTLTFTQTNERTYCDWDYNDNDRPYASVIDDVKKAVFLAGCTEVPEWALQGCISLTEVVIPDGVTYIGRYALKGCSSLSSISLPSSVNYIGVSAFHNCSSLRSLNIPSGVTQIQQYTCCNCSSLMTATIPDTVTSIGSQAFDSCRQLKATVPSSVTSINSTSFVSVPQVTLVNFTPTYNSDWNGPRYFTDGTVLTSFVAGQTYSGTLYKDEADMPIRRMRVTATVNSSYKVGFPAVISLVRTDDPYAQYSYSSYRSLPFVQRLENSGGYTLHSAYGANEITISDYNIAKDKVIFIDVTNPYTDKFKGYSIATNQFYTDLLTNTETGEGITCAFDEVFPAIFGNYGGNKWSLDDSGDPVTYSLQIEAYNPNHPTHAEAPLCLPYIFSEGDLPAGDYVGTLQFSFGTQANPEWFADHP